MIAVEPQLVARACPVCGATSGRELAAARIDTAALDEYAFASRKFPEYMHHRLVECPACDTLYANPLFDFGGIAAAYDAAAFDRRDRPVTRNGLELRRGGDLDTASRGRVDDRLGERMLTLPFDASDEPQELDLVDAVCQRDVDDLRLTAR